MPTVARVFNVVGLAGSLRRGSYNRGTPPRGDRTRAAGATHRHSRVGRDPLVQRRYRNCWRPAERPAASLGPYQEALRLYLLRKTRIPDGVVQLVTLSTALDDIHNRVSAMPWLFERKPEYRSYKFIVTGFTFHMFFGMMIPKPIRLICSARHGFLYTREDRDSDLLKTMAVMANRAEKRASSARNRRRCSAPQT
jgi:hypothetical protein